MESKKFERGANAFLKPIKAQSEAEKEAQNEIERICAISAEILNRAKNWKGRRPPFVVYGTGTVGAGIIRAGQITVVQGAYGCHKSRVAETLAALLISQPDARGDFLGFSKGRFSTGNKVLYIDSEREESEELPEMLVEVNRIAGNPPGVFSNRLTVRSIAGVKRDQRLKVVQRLIEMERYDMDKADIGDWSLTVFIDVLTDAVSNFNSEAEALALFDFLKRIITGTNTGIVCVIHENPGSTGTTGKARGHMGTEAWNKSACVIALKLQAIDGANDMEIFKMDFLKTRGYRKPESGFFCWNENSKWIVRTGEPDREALDIHSVFRDVSDCFFSVEGEGEKYPTTTMLREALTHKAEARGEKLTRDAQLYRIKALQNAQLIDIKQKGTGKNPDIWQLPKLPF